MEVGNPGKPEEPDPISSETAINVAGIALLNSLHVSVIPCVETNTTKSTESPFDHVEITQRLRSKIEEKYQFPNQDPQMAKNKVVSYRFPDTDPSGLSNHRLQREKPKIGVAIGKQPTFRSSGECKYWKVFVEVHVFYPDLNQGYVEEWEYLPNANRMVRRINFGNISKSLFPSHFPNQE